MNKSSNGNVPGVVTRHLPTNATRLSKTLNGIREAYVAGDPEAMRRARDDAVQQIDSYYNHFAGIKPYVPTPVNIASGTVDALRRHRVALALMLAREPDEHGRVGRNRRWIADRAGCDVVVCGKVLNQMKLQGYLQAAKYPEDRPHFTRWWMTDDDYAVYSTSEGTRRQVRIAKNAGIDIESIDLN